MKTIFLSVSVLTMLLALPITAHAVKETKGRADKIASQLECRATPWPFSRKDDARSLKSLLDGIKRGAVIEYFFAELVHPGRPSLASSLGKFLAGTELNPDLRAYWKLLVMASEDPAAEIELKEVCSLYAKVLTSN